MRGRLLRAFAITESDLAQNRDGRLSRHQRWLLRERLKRVPPLPQELMVVGAGLVAVGIINLLQDGGWLGMALCSAPGLVLIVFALTRGRYPIQSLQRDLEAATVWQVDGTLRLEAYGRRPVRYRAHVGPLDFWLPNAIYMTLHDGLEYEVYYTPRSLTVVAMVPVLEPELGTSGDLADMV